MTYATQPTLASGVQPKVVLEPVPASPTGHGLLRSDAYRKLVDVFDTFEIDSLEQGDFTERQTEEIVREAIAHVLESARTLE
jgi:hypothetical protein